MIVVVSTSRPLSRGSRLGSISVSNPGRMTRSTPRPATYWRAMMHALAICAVAPAPIARSFTGLLSARANEREVARRWTSVVFLTRRTFSSVRVSRRP